MLYEICYIIIFYKCDKYFHSSSMDAFLSIILYFKSRPFSIILFYHTYFWSWKSRALHIPSFNLKSFNFTDKMYTHFSVECE